MDISKPMEELKNLCKEVIYLSDVKNLREILDNAGLKGRRVSECLSGEIHFVKSVIQKELKTLQDR